MSYNVLYNTLPTFNKNSIGYIDPSSQYIYDPSGIAITQGPSYTTLASFNSILPGVYIFNLSGSFTANNSTSLFFYLSTDQNAPTSGFVYGFTECVNPSDSLGTPSICNIFSLTSTTTLYLVGNSSNSTGTVFKGTFSLCRIA